MGGLFSKRENPLEPQLCPICHGEFTHRGVNYVALTPRPRGSAPLGPIREVYPRNVRLPAEELIEIIGNNCIGGVTMTHCKHVFHTDCLIRWVIQ